ncbi:MULTISPECIES: TIGR02147 family protein [unclassified Fibrobacter]|uniref:TIGR02147 family protein n=1 Tax=unclassified Fibrobacter TaxID=2634177 RepID=UPI000923FFAE|nr:MULTISPECIES: TIGR02147 family protein [unclassified Fibrobacter]SHK51531.1 TIGR02147 family protein [Fibrobacter sp. UWB12]SIO27963.1 TIGR02147 family protein [Fibrobacter sp. UWB11]
MKSIFEYRDYHLYLQDYYDERKRLGSFSWREFCRNAGFSSPNFLKLVCMGQSKLSKIKACQVAKSMGLVDYEEQYFYQLVAFGNAENNESQRAALLEMQRIALEHEVRVVDKEAFQYYESWKYPVIRELAPLMPGATPRDIAEECKEYVSAEEVRDVLNFLVKAGFLKKEDEKVYTQTAQTVIGSKEALPIAIRAMHKEMAIMAARAVDRYSASERFFNGITLGVNQDAYKRIVEEIKACCKKVVAIANECGNFDQVCRINFQFFPVTNKIIGKKHA